MSHRCPLGASARPVSGEITRLATMVDTEGQHLHHAQVQADSGQLGRREVIPGILRNTCTCISHLVAYYQTLLLPKYALSAEIHLQPPDMFLLLLQILE